MQRREFLLVSAGAGGAVAATGTAAGRGWSGGTTARLQQQETDDDAPDEVVVELGDYFYRVADTGQDLADDPLEIEPGTPVRFVWITNNHDIFITDQPADSVWEGVTPVQDAPFEHEHTFDVEGTYAFHCTPHVALGMEGSIVVEEGITERPAVPLPPGQQPLDPHEIGVPLQKHFIGIATFFAIFLTLVFAFYVLKYGETPHSGYPNQK